MLLLCLALAFLADSKLSASKVSGGAAAATCSDEAPQPPPPAADEPPPAAEAEPPPPLATLGGEPIDAPIAETHELDGRTVHLRPLHDELQLTYVHNLVGAAEVARLVEMADGRGGFIRSPLKSQASGDGLDGDARRTSTSCPMLWPHAYNARRAEIAAARPEMLAELDLATALTERAAALFTATGLPLGIDQIEPLQLVRYQPGELFSAHHDYHESGESSVQGEQRMFTVLVFGSTLGADDGGQTHFPHLNVSVTPRAGDALVWMNVDEAGEPNPRSLHEGRPPASGEKIAINCWVSDRPFDTGAMGGAVRT